MSTLPALPPAVKLAADLAARSNSPDPSPTRIRGCRYGVWWTPCRPGDVRLLHLATSRLMAESAAVHLRRQRGGRTAVLDVDQAEARRIARASPRLVDPMKVSDLARIADCDTKLMRRAIRAVIAEDLACIAKRDGVHSAPKRHPGPQSVRIRHSGAAP